jgi:acetoin utilization protein AcuB
MLVSEVIKKNPSPLSPKDDLAELYWEDFEDGLSYVPVVEEDRFLGFLSLSNLEMEKEINQKVGQCTLELVEKPVSSGQHLFEVLVLFRKADLPILPVLGENGIYEGFILIDQVLAILADSFAFQTEGGVIVLTVKAQDYSLSEISRLVESNQSKILAVVVEADPFTHQRLFVHLKINEKDLTRIVATLERFEYQVVEVHHKSDSSSLDKERLDSLMKYLGI